MKKISLLSLALLSLFVLLACSSKKETQPSSSQPSSSKASSSSSQSSSEKKTEQTDLTLYDPILEMYAQAVQAPVGSRSYPDVNNIVYVADNHPTVYSGVFYSYYDLDKNGTQELIIGMGRINADVKYDLLDIYTIADGKPLRLTTPELFLQSIGERMILTPLEDGTFQYRGASSAWDAQYIHYKFNDKGTGLEALAEGTSQEALGQLAKPLDLGLLTWKNLNEKASPAPASGTSMDDAAIKNGDYSSIAGTWRDGYGNTFVFDAQGLVSDTVELSKYGADDQNGFVSIGAGPKQGMVGGFMIVFIPKGRDFTSTTSEEIFRDASDQTKDRIWAGQGVDGRTDPKAFYYKVD